MICPVSWSEAEGKGMDDPPDENGEVRFAVGTSKAGVISESVAAGEEMPEGVEACKVANRSGSAEEAIGRLHPNSKRTREIVGNTLSLRVVQFN